MATAAVTNTFAAGTLIESAEANTNFQDLVSFLNTQAIHKDGTIAFTGTPSGPGSDPVSDNQYARKLYVDRGPKVVSVKFATSAIRSTGSAVYVDWPAGEVFSTFHTKRMASTQIWVGFWGSGWNNATVLAEFAVKVDGAGSDHGLTRFFANTNQVGEHGSFGGAVLIPGLSAASHEYTLRARVSGSEHRCDTNDLFVMTIIECN